MQTEVKLTAVYAGLGQAIFSHTVLDFQNQLTINGNVSNDGDVYTNGNFSLANNTSISGSVYAQGGAQISQGIVKQDVWAKNAVTLTSGIAVFGKVTSSVSSITLSSNSHIYGNAKAGTTITGGTIDGTKTPNSSSGPPPQRPFPQITYDPKPWTDAGYTIMNFGTCALAKAFIDAMPVGNYVVRVTPTCALSWGNNSTVNIKGNLALITDGSISTVNQTNWNSVGGPWTVFFLVPYRTGLNCTKPSPYDVSVSNNTGFNNGLKLFVYSQCNVDFGNNNAEGVNGQIIGGTVTITNQMTLNYKPIIVPGFNLTGYNEQTSYLREIVNQ
jgi:cytoskeletal protein CcmA (bactofilin family)